MNQEITLSINDILHTCIQNTNLHVHVVHELQLTECMSNVLNLAVSAVTGAAKSYVKIISTLSSFVSIALFFGDFKLLCPVLMND